MKELSRDDETNFLTHLDRYNRVLDSRNICASSYRLLNIKKVLLKYVFENLKEFCQANIMSAYITYETFKVFNIIDTCSHYKERMATENLTFEIIKNMFKTV